MPEITTDDGVDLYYEEVGQGTPIVFVHEFCRGFSKLRAASPILLPTLPVYCVQRSRLFPLEWFRNRWIATHRLGRVMTS